MNKKKLGIFIVLLILVTSISLSYAYWQFNKVQKDFNVAGTSCFSLTYIDNTDSLILDNIVPTEDEEGLNEKGYSFTIKNTCNTTATYEVNLEDILSSSDIKHMPNKYIKVSLNDSTPKVLNTYEEVKTTISNATSSFKLTSGSLKPDEEATYELKLWMDSETPAIDEVMSATFESKITVNTSYIEEENLANDITIIATSQNEGYSKEKETFMINITSTNKNIIEYSFNNQNWTSVTPTKKLTIEKEYIKEGSYPIYVKDEVGKIKEYLIKTDKLDQTAPERKIESINNQESYLLKITMTDTKSGMSSYQITESKETPSEWLDYTDVIEKEITQNGIYYIWSKDKLGNISYEAYSIDKIDKEAPSIELSHTLTDWGDKDTINIRFTDDVIGLLGYQVTTSEEEPTSFITIENTLDTTITYDVTKNGTYYVYAKDAYNHISHEKIVIDKVDNTAPVISSITNSSNGEWTKEDVTITIHATDIESGISKYQIKYSGNNNTWTDLSSNSNTDTWSVERNETVYYRALDKAGNISAEKSTIIKIDKTKPTAKLSASISGNNVTINASSSSDTGSGISTYYYSKDGGSTFVSSTSSSYTFTGLSDGTYTMALKVSDKVGLVSTTVTSSQTLKYTWVVSYNANGGSGAPGNQTKYGGSSLTLSSTKPTRANSTVATYTVTFNGNGGSSGSSSLSATKTRKYTFSKWNTNTSGTGTSYNPGATYSTNANLTLYAIWSTSDTTSSISMPNATRSGYTFNGWYTASSGGTRVGGNGTSLTPSANVTYYAQWTALTATTVISNLVGNGQVVNDDPDRNARFIGSNPNNYVTFNGEKAGWRIIGVMNTPEGKRVKLIRASSIGSYTWDNKRDGTGSSESKWGSNDWTDSALKVILNSGAYYNRTSGACPSGASGATKYCDFTSNGLTDNAKNQIDTITWKLGGLKRNTTGISSNWYTSERGTTVFYGRPTTWTGKVGLMYPSDYGYATAGGTSMSRASCLNVELINWKNTVNSDCKNNNWLFSSSEPQWTITPSTTLDSTIFEVRVAGDILDNAGTLDAVRPVVYLKTSVSISGGSGTSSNPYILS